MRSVTRTAIGAATANKPGTEPAGIATVDGAAERAAGEEIGHDLADARAVADAPSRRRLVERRAEAKIAGRGDRGGRPERRGQGARHLVGAAMAAEQRHHGAAVFGQRQHRRRRPCLSVRQGASARIKPAAAAQSADDRASRREHRAQMIRRRGEGNHLRPPRHGRTGRRPRGRAAALCTRRARGSADCAGHDDDRASSSPAIPPGAAPHQDHRRRNRARRRSSTSSSGRIACSGSMARST